MKALSNFIFFVMIASLSACHWGTSGTKAVKQDSLIFKSLDTLKVDSLNKLLTQDGHESPKNGAGFLGGKGKTWKLWRALHKDCQKNDVAKDMVYFGVSNTLGLGTIVEISKDGKIMPDFKLLREKLTEDQIKVVFNDGTPASCQFDQTTKVTADFLAQSQFSTASSGDLNAAFGNTKDVTAKMDSWQSNDLLKGGLAVILKDTTNAYLKNYKSRLAGENRYVIANEIQVNGFSATIVTNTAISADLKVKLQAGMIQNVGDTAAQVKFTYVNDTTIKMTTVGKFVVFCTLIEAKYVN